MKKLTKIRLINWHYFANETIDVQNNILLTGQNATGKSTILDAITFVITAGDTAFNLAANERGKRDLKGYVKCKLGTNDREYLRNGDVTGHIALEFYDEKDQSYFTVGTVIDAFSDLLPAKTIFYVIEECISDRFFVNADGIILGTVDFKKVNTTAEVFLSKKEAKRAFRVQFGNLNEDFFKLIPKALAFKPIADVKEFIYQHLLEEKEIDVNNIKESIRSYKELERTLRTIKDKIVALHEIEEIYGDYKTTIDRKNYYRYILRLLEEKAIYIKIEKAQKELLQEEDTLGIKEAQIRRYNDEIEALEERIRQIYNVLHSDNDFAHVEFLDKELLKGTQEEQMMSQELLDYSKKVSFVKDVIRDLRRANDHDTYKKLANLPLNQVAKEQISATRLTLIDLEDEFNQRISFLNRELLRKEDEKSTLLTEINEISMTLKGLEDRKLNYSPMLMALKNEIQQGLNAMYGYDVSVYILAELLEIDRPEWQDTIEVYLGNRRFNLIVEPRYFDAALQIYNRVKSAKRLYGIGLVNTKKISDFNDCKPNSLAAIISSENIDAKRYINYAVGNVIMCDDVRELERYSQAITIDGMLYSGFTVSSLNFNIQKPFIGRDACNRQVFEWTERATEKRDAYHQLKKEIDMLGIELNAIQKIDLKSIAKSVDLATRLDDLKMRLEELRRQKKHAVDITPGEVQQDYDKSIQTLKRLKEERDQTNQSVGGVKNKIQSIQQQIFQLKEELSSISAQLEEIKMNHLAIEKEATQEISDCFAQSKDVLRHVSHYEKLHSTEEANAQNLGERISMKQFAYNQKYNTIYGIGITELPRFFHELQVLEKSEIVSYENKVRNARESAEILFKEDFLSKLRNYIMSAEDEINKINETLKGIQFGEDTYEFIFPKSKEYSTFYDMVTSGLDEHTSGLFTIDFELKYNEQLDELFSNLAQDELNTGAINKFTDYRTYMDYDIKITNKSGEEIYYSKVSKEKSGGETQVPFYVAIIASFVRIYQKSNRFAQDAIGLVMFDEVFDKMDSARMRAMMGFITTMPLQIILACPPQRMNILSEYTDTTIITLRNGERAQIANMVKKDFDEE